MSSELAARVANSHSDNRHLAKSRVAQLE